MMVAFLLWIALQSMNYSDAYVTPRRISKHHEIHKVHSRRDILHQLSILAPFAIPSKSHALEQCKAKSHNCIRTTWIAPPSMSSGEAIASIRDVINSYPQEGQAGVDCNGWVVTNDSLDKDGKITLEFRSCVGPAAIAINFAQPFIDDLKLELDKDSSGRITVEVKSNSRMGSSDLLAMAINFAQPFIDDLKLELDKDSSGRIAVEVKSNSRMGSGDLFVNRKRLLFLGDKLGKGGWNISDPKYVYEI